MKDFLIEIVKNLRNVFTIVLSGVIVWAKNILSRFF